MNRYKHLAFTHLTAKMIDFSTQKPCWSYEYSPLSIFFGQTVFGVKILLTLAQSNLDAMIKTFTLGSMLLVAGSAFAANTSMAVMHFSAKPAQSKVEISWEALPEKSGVTYVIERSKDGELWGEILAVTGGEAESTQTFIESDYNPIQGISYYRLKKVYHDGLHAYSTISVVKNEGNLGTHEIPLDEKDYTGLFNEREIIIVLKDQKGDEYFSKIYVLDQPASLVGLDLEERLPQGNYIVTASSNESLVSLPLTVK